MKFWDDDHFVHGSLVSDALGSDAVDRVAAPQAEYAWLGSLPIAAAIFQHSNDNIKQVATNRLFHDLAIGHNREAGLDLGVFAQLVTVMTEQKRVSHFECWRSADPVSRRELEISIARFGETEDMFLLSLVDRTAEALSRVNLRREMLSDSLTGFCNRTGFENPSGYRSTFRGAN